MSKAALFDLVDILSRKEYFIYTTVVSIIAKHLTTLRRLLQGI